MFLITGNNHELLEVSIKSVFLLLPFVRGRLPLYFGPQLFCKKYYVLLYLLTFWTLQLPAVNIKINFLGV